MASNIKFRGDFSRINEEEKGFINKILEKFVEKHEKNFHEMHISVDIELSKGTSRGRAMHDVKFFVDTTNGKFHSENNDFGAEKTLHGAIEKVERQMEKHLEKG